MGTHQETKLSCRVPRPKLVLRHPLAAGTVRQRSRSLEWAGWADTKTTSQQTPLSSSTPAPAEGAEPRLPLLLLEAGTSCLSPQSQMDLNCKLGV